MTAGSTRTDLQVDDLLQGDVKLASPPEIYVRLRRLVDDPATTTNALAEIIGRDPALTARLLQLANSAFFALHTPVCDLAEAIRRVGLSGLQNLVLATEVIRHFDGIPPDLADIYRFWRHSLRCAVLARSFALQRPYAGDVDPLFVGGLLHDIGHLVLYARLPELSRKALLEHRHRHLPLHQAERETIGFDYAAVGGALARHWELPAPIYAILAYHLAPADAGRHRREAAVVHIAVMASEAGSFVADEVAAKLTREPQVWEMAGLSPKAVDDALPEAECAFNSALALLHG